MTSFVTAKYDAAGDQILDPNSTSHATGSGGGGTVTNPYTLPAASATVLGGIKAGTGVTIAGDGTLSVPIQAGGGSSAGVDATDIGFDIILADGQSNMWGQTAGDALVDNSDGRVFMFGCDPNNATYYQQILLANLPYQTIAGNGGLGAAPWCAKAYAASLPSNRKVLIIPASKGTTTLVAGNPEWAPGNPGGVLYEAAIAQTNLAIALAKSIFPASRYVGAISIQGESDGIAGVSNGDYYTAKKALIAGFRARITGATNSWYVIGSMVPEAIANRVGLAAIDAAHQQLAVDLVKVGFVQGPAGMSLGDNLHYSVPGQRVMGARMGLAINRTIAGQGALPDTTAPIVSSASVANGTASNVSIIFSEMLNAGSVPAASAFGVTNKTVTAVTINANIVNLTVTPAFTSGEVETASYIAPGVNAVKDNATTPNAVVSFSGVAITNAVGSTTNPANALRNTNLVSISESGTGPYIYTGTGGAFDVNEGKSEAYGFFQAGVDGSYVIQGLNGNNILLGVDPKDGSEVYETMQYSMINTSNYVVFTSNGTTASAVTVDNTVAATFNDYMKVARVGTSLIFSASHDAGSTWTVVKTFTNVSAGILHPKVNVANTGGFKVISTTGLG